MAEAQPSGKSFQSDKMLLLTFLRRKVGACERNAIVRECAPCRIGVALLILARVFRGRSGLSRPQPVRASLFVTCIVDQLYPEVGVSVVRVLRRHGVAVDFPAGQSCCGQPLYNSGFTAEAKKLAERTLDAMANCEYVVVPSGSCGAMLRVFYRDLFADDGENSARAQELSNRVYEFTEFLTEVVGVETPEAAGTASAEKVAYHPSCHLLREMEVRETPAKLLQSSGSCVRFRCPTRSSAAGSAGLSPSSTRTSPRKCWRTRLNPSRPAARIR